MSKYLVIILFLVCSCMDKNKNSHSDKVGEGVNFPLTEDVNQILDALVERYSTVSRSMLQYEPDKTLVELKKFSIEACPYYEFDVQKFYAAPSPAQRQFRSLSGHVPYPARLWPVKHSHPFHSGNQAHWGNSR